ncbi:MAG: ScpA family protein [Alphaproteobacteria bacterium]|nr:ScpA family protein [Alphaproteobacteria bacterium]
MNTESPFEEAPQGDGAVDSQLVVSLEGYEGPLDVLLDLARAQKVDLAQISILHLAEQYLVFVTKARKLRLELAADYLVMAAWLAFLKSKLLLPQTPEEAEAAPSGEAMAEALRFQLQRLEAMRESGQGLMGRPQLGVDVFARGAPEGITVIAHRPYEISLYELLSAYGDQRRRKETQTLHIPPTLELFSMDDAMERLVGMIGQAADWRTLNSFLPPGLKGGLMTRSALAATFAASLELARVRAIQLRQTETFGPIYLRKTQAQEQE